MKKRDERRLPDGILGKQESASFPVLGKVPLVAQLGSKEQKVGTKIFMTYVTLPRNKLSPYCSEEREKQDTIQPLSLVP